LPTDPALALVLSAATGRSMAWMLEASGLSAAGVNGRLRTAGLVGVWLYALRAWTDDESVDLATTMSALDKALDQAEKLAGMLPGASAAAAPPTPPPEPEEAAAIDMIAANPPPLSEVLCLARTIRRGGPFRNREIGLEYEPKNGGITP
jgi:hypothetical protein